MSSMDVDFYRSQKSICLGGLDAEQHDLTPPAQDGVSDVWGNVYRRRVELARASRAPDAPVVFPGRPAVLSHLYSAANFGHSRLQCFRENRLLIDSELTIASADTQSCHSWKWRTLKPAVFRAVQSAGNSSRSHSSGRLHFSSRLHRWQCASLPLSRSQVLDLFSQIHSAWGAVEAPNYDAQAISTVLDWLEENSCFVEKIIELEEFASYCTLRKQLHVVASGFYNDKWIDVAAEPIDTLRATEKCWPVRVLQELSNLAAGRTAPIIINEFGCISDGNHRLSAAWIWNMLNACGDASWRTGEPGMEAALSSFLNDHQGPKTNFAIANALECLSTLLNNRDASRAIYAQAPQILASRVDRLPVVPMLAYNSLAIEREIFETAGELVRFDPRHYEIIRDNSTAFLPARACYHFADRVPLPWFSVLVPSGAVGKLKAMPRTAAQTTKQTITPCGRKNVLEHRSSSLLTLNNRALI